MYWAEIEKVDIFDTIRTYWAEVLKKPSISQNLATFCENVCLHLNRPKKVILGQLLYIKGSLRLIPTYLGLDRKSGQGIQILH